MSDAWLKRLALAACAMAATGVGGCDAGAAAGDRSEDVTAAAEEQSPGPDASSPEPAVDPVTDTVPAGVWQLRTKVLTSNNTGWNKVGAKETLTWTMEADCDDAESCDGRIESSSGNEFTYRWDGKELTVVPTSPVVQEGRCFTEDGKRAPGTHSKLTMIFAPVLLRASPAAAAGESATRFEGSAVQRAVVSELRGGCTNGFADAGSPRPKSTEHWVLTVKR